MLLLDCHYQRVSINMFFFVNTTGWEVTALYKSRSQAVRISSFKLHGKLSVAEAEIGRAYIVDSELHKAQAENEKSISRAAHFEVRV